MASTLIEMASTLVAMASTLVAMAYPSSDGDNISTSFYLQKLGDEATLVVAKCIKLLYWSDKH